MKPPTLEEWAIALVSKDWERTPRGKVICPDCGKTGYSGGSWTRNHIRHVTCVDCRRTVTAAGLGQHRRSCPGRQP